MLNIKLSEESSLCVSSSWDSGTHIGFHASVHESGEYVGKTLDRVISRTQIMEIEALIACRLRAMLRKEGNFIEEFDSATDINLKINTATVVEEMQGNKKE